MPEIKKWFAPFMFAFVGAYSLRRWVSVGRWSTSRSALVSVTGFFPYGKG
jgi:hypothetical protein